MSIYSVIWIISITFALKDKRSLEAKQSEKEQRTQLVSKSLPVEILNEVTHCFLVRKESQNDLALDKADEVCVYARLPRTFQIPTPVGKLEDVPYRKNGVFCVNPEKDPLKVPPSSIKKELDCKVRLLC